MRLDRRAARAALLAFGLADLSLAAAAQSPLRLLVWINGDKGYNGLQKVGDEFSRQTGVRVVVQHF
jgi:maltose/maltodextrin transport system substrate-binding protein